jgi:hypothetical protein
VVRYGGRQHLTGERERLRRREPQPDVPAGHEPLQLLRGALGNESAMIQYGDLIRELIGFLQDLRGQEDRDATGDQFPDQLPHAVPAARVEAGGGLVQEDDPRIADQRHGQVEPPLHAAGVRHRHLRAGLDQVERSSSSSARLRPGGGRGGAGRPS